MPMLGRGIIGKRMREARERVGLSQKSLGIAAGIDEFSASPRINQYERAVHVPDVVTLSRIAEVLKVPTSYFLAEDDNLAEILLLLNRATEEDLVKIRNILGSK